MEQTEASLGAAGIAALVISALFIAAISVFVAGAVQGLVHFTAGVLSLALGWRLTRKRRGAVQLLVIPLVTLVGLMVGSILYDFARLALG